MKDKEQKEQNNMVFAGIPSHGVLQLLRVFIRFLVARIQQKLPF